MTELFGTNEKTKTHKDIELADVHSSNEKKTVASR